MSSIHLGFTSFSKQWWRDPAGIMGVTRPSWGLPWGSRGLWRESDGGAGDLNLHRWPRVGNATSSLPTAALSGPSKFQCPQRFGPCGDLLSIFLEKRVWAKPSICSTPSTMVFMDQLMCCPGGGAGGQLEILGHNEPPLPCPMATTGAISWVMSPLSHLLRSDLLSAGWYWWS